MWQKKPPETAKTRHAIDNIVAEIDLSTDDTDTTYERLITRNALNILEIIDKHIKKGNHRLNGCLNHVLTATFLCYGKAKNSIPHKIKISDLIEIKFGTVDYVG